MSDVDLKKVVEMVGGEPVVKFVKGDVAGHEFHGNQYTIGSGANPKQDSKKFSRDAEKFGAQAEERKTKSSYNSASLAHGIAAEMARNAGDSQKQSYHEQKAKEYGALARSAREFPSSLGPT